MKQFLFLYPIREFFDFEIENGAYSYDRRFTLPDEEDFARKIENAKTEQEKQKLRAEALKIMSANFRQIYSRIINACITSRYRDDRFGINYAIFEDKSVDGVIHLSPEDNVFKVGLTFMEHTQKREEGTFPYPDSDRILDSINLDGEHLRIAGFHIWDCVERVARRAYERGIDVLVDEDLTELFNGRLSDKDFQQDSFPSYKPRKQGKRMFELFMGARRGKPLLWQDY